MKRPPKNWHRLAEELSIRVGANHWTDFDKRAIVVFYFSWGTSNASVAIPISDLDKPMLDLERKVCRQRELFATQLGAR